MADTTILAAGAEDVPASYTVPASQVIQPKAVRAVIDGTGASGDFVPVLQIVSDAGIVVAEGVCTTTITAGGSAQVSWFPHVAAAAAAAAGYTLEWASMQIGDGSTPVTIGATTRTTLTGYAYADHSGTHMSTNTTNGKISVGKTVNATGAVGVVACAVLWDMGVFTALATCSFAPGATFDSIDLDAHTDPIAGTTLVNNAPGDASHWITDSSLWSLAFQGVNSADFFVTVDNRDASPHDVVEASLGVACLVPV